jgi:molybdopterin molybdotransferase
MPDNRLIPVDEVLALLDAGVKPAPAGPVALDKALGCVLAADVHAASDQPEFDRSAIDGYAVAAGATAGKFVLTGAILPGEPAPPTPRAGTAWKLFTGSSVPLNAGLVMLEDAVEDGDHVTLRRAASTDMIRRRGSSVRAGARLLAAGDRIGPGEIAVLASAGVVRPKVIPPPRVLHLTTGREVVPAKTVPGPGQIRDTNGPLIQALLRTAGAVPLATCHVDENVDALVQAVQAAGDFDLLLVSGGSSVGEHDRTPQALAALGFEVLVRRVNVRPGKPLLVARRGDQWAFGVPGNPVSHFATFHVFVSRMIRRMRALPAPVFRRFRLGAGANLSANARETFWPAQLDSAASPAVVLPRPWLDSGDLAALAGINALIRLPAGHAPAVGDEVEVVVCGEPV